MNILADYLWEKFEPVFPMAFYREIFGDGELDADGKYTPGKYTAIAVEIARKGAGSSPKVYRHTVTDELDKIAELLHSPHFVVIAPISYAGKSRNSTNARFMYALCVELDNLLVRNGKQVGLEALISQWSDSVAWIPRPTYIVASGTGVHLYWRFARPVPLFANVAKSLATYKRELTKMIWNQHTTSDFTDDRIQQESIFQGFRMVGSLTKSGDRVEAFRTGEPVTIAYLNSFITKLAYKSDCGIVELYKSDLNLKQAQERFPEWFEKRVVQKQPRGRWVANRAVYDWWRRRILSEAVVGHRYYCLMMLSIYAIKCDIDASELETDLLKILPVFEARTTSDDNHFTLDDVMDALQAYEDKGMVTYPISSIENRSGLKIQKNKRNSPPRDRKTTHQQYRRGLKQLKIDLGEAEGWNRGGRPEKSNVVINYMVNYPWIHRKIDVAKGAGVSRPTVDKYWDEGLEAREKAKKQAYSELYPDDADGDYNRVIILPATAKD